MPAPATWPPPWPAASAEPVCPSGSAWSGSTCVRTLVVNEVWCPPGSTWDGGRCVGVLIADCPAGTRFVEGDGCVPVLAAQAAPPAPAPSAPAAPSQNGVVDPWNKPRGNRPAGGASAGRGTCDCRAGDLMCMMRCTSAGTAPVQNAGRPFDRNAAMVALRDAETTAKRCTGVAGTGTVRVTLGPSGKATSATVDGPFAGTPQGGCIAAVFRAITVPPFDGSPVAVSKSVVVP